MKFKLIVDGNIVAEQELDGEFEKATIETDKAFTEIGTFKKVEKKSLFDSQSSRKGRGVGLKAEMNRIR